VRRAPLASTLVAVAAVLAAIGCGGDDEPPAAGPATTAAPTTTAPATTSPATTPTAPATTAEEPAGPGSVAAGKQVFQGTCSGCHAGLGTRTGYGPKLAGKGLTTASIRTTVQNGRGPMPAGLVSGQELEDVVAYVFSLQ
jgi:cytochrome c551